jgi:hypothetical protein
MRLRLAQLSSMQQVLIKLEQQQLAELVLKQVVVASMEYSQRLVGQTLAATTLDS